MAPEQARGQGERIDARTDVFGLGAVLYYLLTGMPPHEGETLKEVLEQARDAPIVAPRQLNRRVPRALERICLKATASDPKLRYSSADALRQALGRYRLMRRLDPALVAVAVLLSLLVPAWALWLAPAPPSQEGSRAVTSSRVTSEPRTEPDPVVPPDLRVTRFEIPAFPKLDDKSDNLSAAGLLGKKSFILEAFPVEPAAGP